jgi:predicted O-linked N-acetylglucosamine transferase (SPINDLY family)
MFARKPAPVQVTYLAYCSTTGLDTIDYRITDPYLDPPDDNQRGYSEKSVWLPNSYWCYEPYIQAPAVGPLPAAQAGHVTFGCLNTFSKVTAPTLVTWAELLRQVPGSHLVLHASRGDHRRRLLEQFGAQGIDSDRITFVGKVPLEQYLEIYNQIDIGLDPFPYAGGTTTCDALWMGVPVVSLAGRIAVSRGGLSILSNVGMPELVAHDRDEYLRIAIKLAGDLARLSEVRSNLRDRMRTSPLMDGRRFAADVEAAYRQIWREACDRPVCRETHH